MCGIVKGGGAAIVSVDAEVSSTNQQVVGWKTRLLIFCRIEFIVIYLGCVQSDDFCKNVYRQTRFVFDFGIGQELREQWARS